MKAAGKNVYIYLSRKNDRPPKHKLELDLN